MGAWSQHVAGAAIEGPAGRPGGPADEGVAAHGTHGGQAAADGAGAAGGGPQQSLSDPAPDGACGGSHQPGSQDLPGVDALAGGGLLVVVLPGADDGSGDGPARDRSQERSRQAPDDDAGGDVLPVIGQPAAGCGQAGGVRLVPRLQVRVAQRPQAGGVGQVDRVVAGVGVRVARPAGSQDRLERVG